MSTLSCQPTTHARTSVNLNQQWRQLSRDQESWSCQIKTLKIPTLIYKQPKKLKTKEESNNRQNSGENRKKQKQRNKRRKKGGGREDERKRKKKIRKKGKGGNNIKENKKKKPLLFVTIEVYPPQPFQPFLRELQTSKVCSQRPNSSSKLPCKLSVVGNFGFGRNGIN